MSLSSLPTALLIPPINLVPLGLVGLWLARRRPRLGRAVTAISLVLLLVLGMPCTGEILLATLEAGVTRPGPQRPRPEASAEAADPGQPGAIIVLGGDGGGDGFGGVLAPFSVGPLTLERLQAGAALSRRLALPILVTGGPLSPGRPPLAQQMARSLREDFGLGAAWIEPRSEDTWQNAEYSVAMLREAGISSAFVVSHSWHLRRALIAFRHFGFTVVPVAPRFGGMPRWDAGELIPRVSGWMNSYYAVHEWLGCVYYTLRG